MSSLSQFAGGNVPVGSIIQAPFNLTDPAWLPCNGQIVNRADYPLLSACVPGVGVFTKTDRTRGVTPTSNALATNGSIWVMQGAPTGSLGIVTTPDGVTYTGRTTSSGLDVRSIIHDGVKFVAVGATGTAHTSSDGVSWSSGGSVQAQANSLQSCLAFSPTLGSVGRICLASGANFYTSDDHGVTWATRAHGIPGCEAFHVTWTGQKFIALTSVANIILTSADGITWAKVTLPITLAASTVSAGSIASDGAGKVVIVSAAAPYQTLTSIDHGATWVVRFFSGATGAVFIPSVASYTNGKFLLAGSGGGGYGVVTSTDLSVWSALLPVPSLKAAFSYKGGVYYCAAADSSGDATLVEDTTKIQLPYSTQGVGFTSGSVSSWNNNLPWIKVK